MTAMRKTKARKSTLAIVAEALGRGLAPDVVVQPSAWAQANLIVADGPLAGHRWDATLTPQLVEILDCLSPDHPCNRVSVRKSHQVGFTGAAIAWLGSIIANTPAKTLVVFPTLDGGREFNAEKFHPTLEETPVLRRRVSEARTRSARASTSLKKRFPGGTITITGANSTADLRSKTVRFLFADEIDDWPADLGGQGDPMKMADARQTAHHETADYKKLEGSTPTIAGESRIDDAFEAGDQRHWQVRCPQCGHEQKLVWANLRFARSYPFHAHYVCAANGCVIEHRHKRAMVLAGRWVPDRPEPGRHPSFHMDTLTSNLTTWDKMVAEWWEAQGKAEKLKAFVNLWLAQSWEERGEAPEWERLYARRADYEARKVPPGGLVLTAGADVQMNGIYYEVVAWGRDRQSWSIDVGFLPGDTANPDSDAWAGLHAVYERLYPTAVGGVFPVDALAVDTGFNTQQAYLWCRRHPRAYAVKGEDGWHRAAISSTPTKVDISWRGKRLRRGVELWHVGTWSLKSELYTYLRLDGRRDGSEVDPPGYCHFSEAVHDDQFLRQLTAEYLKEEQHRGRTTKVWKTSGDNHFHDCRIYAMAMAQRMGVWVMTDEEWRAWEAARGRPPEPAQGSLLAHMTNPAAPVRAKANPEPGSVEAAQHHPGRAPARGRGGYLSAGRGRGGGVLRKP